MDTAAMHALPPSDTVDGLVSRSAVAAVMHRLLDVFMSGEVSPGDRLESERQLATRLGVGRSALREALGALEVLGVVSVRPGSGTYLRGGASELVQQTLSWGLLLSKSRTRDLIEVRHGLELQCARLACGRITEEELARLEGHIDVMRHHEGRHDRFVQADMLFHETVDAASGNPVLIDLVQSVRALIRVWVERALDQSDLAHQTVLEHEAVLAALRDRDVEAVTRAVDVHMESARRRLLTKIEIEHGANA